MSFEIGKKLEGLHEGRWYVFTILTCEKDGYSVTFDGWSRKFDTVPAPQFVRPRSTIDSRKRKPWFPSINFNKLLPDDARDINRCRRFQKASFGTSSGSPPWAADRWMRKRLTDCRFPWCIATACIYTRGQTKKTCCSARHQTIWTSANTTTRADPCQFYSSAVHGHCPPRWYRNRLWRSREPVTKCGRCSFSCPGGLSRRDEWWLTHERSKCQLSDGVAVRSSSNFRLTCPVSEVYRLQNAKFSPQLKKEVLEVRRRSILRFSQALQLNASNRS